MRVSLFVVLSLFCGTCIGCAVARGRPLEISAEEFRTELTSINSAYGSQFIGVSGKRAYLERTSLVEPSALIGFGPSVTIYSTELSDFTAGEQERLRHGESPWHK